MKSVTRRLNAEQAFTLIELLIVIAIISIIAAILFPVFAQAREKARQTTCISNERQLGEAFLQYQQDFDEFYPNGTNGNTNGLSWAGPIYQYVRSLGAFQCPDDLTVVPNPVKPSASSVGFTMYPISYSVNQNLLATSITINSATLLYGAGLLACAASREVAPAQTVLLYEVNGDYAPFNDAQELRNGGTGNRNNEYYSPAGNGVTYQRNGGGPNDDGCMATGVLGGAATTSVVRPAIGGVCGPNAIVFKAAAGVHSGGSNFVLADGHVKWLNPNDVCPGWTAKSPSDAFAAANYGTSSAIQPSAAGTQSSQHYAATFSPI